MTSSSGVFYIAPSYRKFSTIGEPFTLGDKEYIKIDKNGVEKTVRCYREWQSSWPLEDKPRVERKDDTFVAFNYPDGHYAYIIGIRENSEGVRGIWKYTKLPENRYKYNYRDNVCWSPIFGWCGWADEPPIEELAPVFVPESDVLVAKDTYKRLTKYRNSTEEFDAAGIPRGDEDHVV